MTRREAIAKCNELTKQTQEQHRAVYRGKDVGWVVYNAVQKKDVIVEERTDGR